MKYADDILKLNGIGDKTAGHFNKAGIYYMDDLIHYYPRDYQMFKAPIKLKEAVNGEISTLELTLCSDFQWKKVRNLTIGTGMAKDSTGRVIITYFNTPYFKQILKSGYSCLFRGMVKTDNGTYCIEQPKMYSRQEYQSKMGTLQPCYGLTAGLTNNKLIKAVKQALMEVTEEEYLPEELVREYDLISRNEAIPQVHFPLNFDELIKARKRIVFDEFFTFIISLRKLKEMNEEEISAYPMIETAVPDRFMEQLPYSLTNAQKRVWDEVKSDLTSGCCMNRLIQGDVGSGKTILAFLSLLLCITNGYQGALMAPTEILARQHFEQLQHMTQQYMLPVKPVLLTGSVSAGQKKEIYNSIKIGDANIIIGTHALIQEKVEYQKLGLVITDEQHRFGVRQRESLSNKGEHAHVLVMSATPIPRTLAIILYGDLHLSMVDELPANRLSIKNCVVDTGYRKKAYDFIVKEVSDGHQAYIICPMVDDNENAGDIENVTDYVDKLKNAMPENIQVHGLHGKMKPIEKNRIMEEFAAGNIHVLVSTTVIEVGINVPNATVMMIENAERFGLAQLHQLRGRIGRGNAQSYCIFINGSDKKSSIERLKILNKSNDGFFIAEEDLKLRGPGNLFGIRQSGEMEFKMADIYQDSELLKQISITVDRLLKEDGNLEMDKHTLLKRHLNLHVGNSVDFRTI